MISEEDFDRGGGDAGRGELSSAWDGDFWVDVEAQERAEGIINALEDLLHGDVPTEQVRCPPAGGALRASSCCPSDPARLHRQAMRSLWLAWHQKILLDVIGVMCAS